MSVRKLQFQAMTCGGLEDQANVFEMLRQFSLGNEISRDHLKPLGVHLTRIGGTGLQDGEHAVLIEPQRLGERQPFRESRPVEPQHEIADQFDLRR